MYVSAPKIKRVATRYRSTVIPFRPGARGTLGGSDDLSEVQVRVKRIEEPMPEIVVSGQRIPWYVWAILGAVGVSILFGANKS